MRPTLKVLLPALAISLTVAACGSSSAGSSSSSQPSTAPASAAVAASASAALVKTASNATLSQTVLVDANGLTLYRLSGEQDGKFICTSTACLGAWHPLFAPAGGVSAVHVGSLATVKRPEGTEQVTYAGQPLYTFAGDKAPGEANGQGLKDVGTWSAVSPSASAASATHTSSSSTQAPATSSGSEPAGGGYGY